MENNFNPLLNETFVFRPSDVPIEGVVATTNRYKHEGQGLLRYAEGKWIQDDGEPDLAFVHGVFAYGVSLPYSTNILWSWRDIDLSRSFLPKDLQNFTRGWHYQTVNNTHWEDYYWGSFGTGRDKHPNTIAYEDAMHKCSSIHGCANGRGIDLTIDNEWIKRGLLWVQATMQPINAPVNPICFLCLDNGKGHLLEALDGKKSDLECKIEDSWRLHNKAEIDAIDYEDSAKNAEEKLKEIEQRIIEILA